MLSFADTSVARSYRLDANLRLVAAISMKRGQSPVVIPMSDAENNVKVELAYWAAVAVRHPNGK
jgi:hypothetical protein